MWHILLWEGRFEMDLHAQWEGDGKLWIWSDIYLSCGKIFAARRSSMLYYISILRLIVGKPHRGLFIRVNVVDFEMDLFCNF